MRVGFSFKGTNDLQQDVEAMTCLIKDAAKKNIIRLLKKKSIRVLKWNMQTGLHGDDFIQNTFTVLFTGKGYKIPRIIKNMLLK